VRRNAMQNRQEARMDGDTQRAGAYGRWLRRVVATRNRQARQCCPCYRATNHGVARCFAQSSFMPNIMREDRCSNNATGARDCCRASHASTVQTVALLNHARRAVIVMKSCAGLAWYWRQRYPGSPSAQASPQRDGDGYALHARVVLVVERSGKASPCTRRPLFTL